MYLGSWAEIALKRQLPSSIVLTLVQPVGSCGSFAALLSCTTLAAAAALILASSSLAAAAVAFSSSCFSFASACFRSFAASSCWRSASARAWLSVPVFFCSSGAPSLLILDGLPAPSSVIASSLAAASFSSFFVSTVIFWASSSIFLAATNLAAVFSVLLSLSFFSFSAAIFSASVAIAFCSCCFWTSFKAFPTSSFSVTSITSFFVNTFALGSASLTHLWYSLSLLVPVGVTVAIGFLACLDLHAKISCPGKSIVHSVISLTDFARIVQVLILVQGPDFPSVTTSLSFPSRSQCIMTSASSQSSGHPVTSHFLALSASSILSTLTPSCLAPSLIPIPMSSVLILLA